MSAGFLELRERAYAFVAAGGVVSEDALLAQVYGGVPPAALRTQLAAPLLGDGRLERLADGRWTTAGVAQHKSVGDDLAWTSLALLASGPNPERGRLVCVSAVHVRGSVGVERFSATLNPGVRVPGYVAQRLGTARELFEELPTFASIADELVRFLAARPILAQDAHLTWAFLKAEARRAGHLLAEPPLIDANELAIRLLDLDGKPSLALVAAKLGVGTVSVHAPDEEARVLTLVATRLFALARERDDVAWDTLLAAAPRTGTSSLRSAGTARELADEPGVYVMRATDQTALYVGKARRLRSRVASYVHRPLGATRRLEGLVGAVHAVDTTACATDLEALILEDREIRRLQPRFNTVRRQRAPRLWIRLPPRPEQRPGKQLPAPRRLEPSIGPSSDGEGEFVGPFRNAAAADGARLLARRVFDLDAVRRTDTRAYEDQLALAWAFLHGEMGTAESHARQRSRRLLSEVLAFDLRAVLLPADPRAARYAVVRRGPNGIEGFLIDRAIFRRWATVEDGDLSDFATQLLDQPAEARTEPDDVDVVVRWMGAQRPPAQLVCLPDDPLLAADAIVDATSALLYGPGEA